RLARPIWRASAAPTGRPVRIRSRARESPMRRGSRTVPPSMSGTPHLRQKTPKVASSSTTRRSHQSASSRPPATAYPETAAITGLSRSRRVGPIAPSPSGATRFGSPAAMALRSAPEQNVPPAPQRTAPRASGSASKARKGPARASAAARSTALRTSGRSRTTVVTGPCFSTRTGMAASGRVHLSRPDRVFRAQRRRRRRRLDGLAPRWHKARMPIALLVAAALSPAVQAFVQIDKPVVAITRVRVIDGTGGPPREDQTVVISGGKIAALGPSASTPVPEGATVLQREGSSVLPGLVGMHDHLFYPAGGAIFHEMPRSFPRLYLAGGGTTIRTTGSIEPDTDLEGEKEIDSGKQPGTSRVGTAPYLGRQGPC